MKVRCIRKCSGSTLISCIEPLDGPSASRLRMLESGASGKVVEVLATEPSWQRYFGFFSEHQWPPAQSCTSINDDQMLLRVISSMIAVGSAQFAANHLQISAVCPIFPLLHSPVGTQHDPLGSCQQQCRTDAANQDHPFQNRYQAAGSLSTTPGRPPLVVPSPPLPPLVVSSPSLPPLVFSPSLPPLGALLSAS